MEYSFEDYKKDASRTRSELNTKRDNNIHMLFGMSTEVGEMIDVFKKNLAYGKEIDTINLQEELGDLMWYVAGFCEINGFDFYAILKNNIEKLKARYPEKFSSENALNRDLEAERRILEKLG